MHFCMFVKVPRNTWQQSIEALSAAVDRSLAAIAEHHTDWHQVGGRWCGHLAGDGYTPETDPNHQRTCRLCGGTGKRTDMVVPKGCNGCAGTGAETLWPTEWKPRPQDVVATAGDIVKRMAMNPDIEPYGVVIDGEWIEDGSAARFAACDPEDLFVVVDCHG